MEIVDTPRKLQQTPYIFYEFHLDNMWQIILADKKFDMIKEGCI